MKRLIGMALLAGASLAHAQNQTPTPTPSQNIPGAPASAAKKELIQRLLTLQQPALESMARDMVEGPARQMAGDAEVALNQRVPPEKREAAVKQIQEQLRKYGDESSAIVRDRAAKLGQSSLGPLLEEKFSEDELRQLLGALEAPAYKKFQQSLPDMTKVYAETLVKDMQPVITPKLRSLEQSIATALGITSQSAPAPQSKAAKPPAQPASRPAKK
ncbi:MAG: hypothetical protein H7Y33_16165 [Cytophagales bacterium]|nr:hypothetical protein [Rhizobacter sp.]